MPAVAVAAVGAIAATAAASKQSKAIRGATEANVSEQRRQFDLQRSDLAPYRAVGQPALNRLAGIYGLNVEEQKPQVRDAQVRPGDPYYEPPPGTLSPQAQQQVNYARNLLESQGIVANTPAEVLAAATSNSGIYISPTIAEEIRQGATLAEPALEATRNELGDFTVTDTGTDPIQAAIDIENRLLSGFEESPGYGFLKDEVQGAAERAARAGGISNSGRALIEAQNRAQGLASQEFSNFVNRRFSRFDDYTSQLARLAGIGQNAVNTGANIGQQTAANIGNALQQGGSQAGAAQASGYVGAANAVNQGLQNYQFQNYLNQFQPQTAAPAASMAPQLSTSAYSGYNHI